MDTTITRNATVAASDEDRGVSPQDVTVLYIAGEGRSGTTLLGSLMGEVKGCVNVGEMGYLWYRCFPPTSLCGCGAAFDRCEFWTEVIREAFGGFDGVDIERIRETKRTLEHLKRLPALKSGWRSLRRDRSVQEYQQALASVYGAIRKVSGAGVIVDGSKSPMFAATLCNTPGISLSMVHMVRDSRAVAYSWMRKKLDPSIEQYMPNRPAAKSAIGWMLYNGATHLLRPPKKRYLLMRYEDLVDKPLDSLKATCELIGVPEQALDFLDGNRVELSDQHTVSGNPDRFKRSIQVRLDREWEERLSRREKALITAITFPLLWRYRYG